METFIQILSIVLTAATTIIVALVQVKSTKKEKKDAENASLQAELDKQKEEARLAAEERQEQKLEKVAQSVNKIETEITEIKQNQSEMKKQIDRVAQVTTFNLNFSNEINAALEVLGDSIIDQSADENLRKAMQDHRNRTTELRKQLYETTF